MEEDIKQREEVKIVYATEDETLFAAIDKAIYDCRDILKKLEKR